MTTVASDTVRHLQALIARRSITPQDGGAQAYVAKALSKAGFEVESLTFSSPDTPDVPNLFATIGSGVPHLAFVGHTDVVPAGDDTLWRRPPFAGEIAGGEMVGRGAVDMKGAIAAFLSAAAAFVAGGLPKGTLSLLITGDEEGPNVNGMVKLVEWALDRGHRFDGALVGEPTSRRRLGDTIKTGRRGSLSGTVIVTGKQGHAAYQHLADNPIPQLVHILDRLTRIRLDEGSADFEPSNLEVTGIETSSNAFNVIPGEARARFNVRFNDFWSTTAVKAMVKREIAEAGNCELVFEPGESDWFLTRSPTLAFPLAEAIRAVTGVTPEASTTGGTSDARFFKNHCPVIEFGLVGETMHQIDERVPLADLDALTEIYRSFLDRYFSAASR